MREQQESPSEPRAGAERLPPRANDAARWLARLAPEVLSAGVERSVDGERSKWYRVRLGGSWLAVILEVQCHQGALWAHLAITGRVREPSLAELAWCRDVFLGDRRAIQIMPRKVEAFEAGARTAHLYSELEGQSLPSFAPSDRGGRRG